MISLGLDLGSAPDPNVRPEYRVCKKGKFGFSKVKLMKSRQHVRNEVGSPYSLALVSLIYGLMLFTNILT